MDSIMHIERIINKQGSHNSLVWYLKIQTVF